MNNAYQVVNLQAPDTAGQAIRQTTNVTETNLEALTGGGSTALHLHSWPLGDVVGPGSAVDNAITLFNSTTGKLIKESAVTITSGVIAGVGLALTSPIINTILTAATKTGATFTEDGAAELYHNEVKKFETTADGVALPDGALLEIDPTPGTDATGSGDMIKMTVDTNTVGIGGLLHLESDGNFGDADADAEATCSSMLVMALTASVAAGQKVLTRGVVRQDTWSWTVGAVLYASTSPGQMTETPPAGTGDIVRVVGYALSADVIFFDPDKTFIEIV